MEATKESIKNKKAEAEDRIIKITVKAKDLYDKGTDATQSQIDKRVKIKNKGGKESDYGQNKSDFDTHVYLNKNVTWTIASRKPEGKDSGYFVSFKNIDNTANSYFANPILTPTGAAKDTVTGEVVNNSDAKDTYIVNFSIANTNDPKSTPINFSMDPKLKIINP